MDEYYNRIKINVYDFCEDESNKLQEEKLELIALIEATLFDYHAIEINGEDVVDVADSLDGDNYSCIYELVNSKYFDKYDCFGSICSLEKFYTVPEYRQKGIGKYLMNNLCDVIKYFTNEHIDYIVAFLKPMELTNKGWNHSKSPKAMEKIMVDFLKNVVLWELKGLTILY